MQHWLVAKKNFSTCWTLAVMPNVMVLCHILSERDDNTVEAPLMDTSLQWQHVLFPKWPLWRSLTVHSNAFAIYYFQNKACSKPSTFSLVELNTPSLLHTRSILEPALEQSSKIWSTNLTKYAQHTCTWKLNVYKKNGIKKLENSVSHYNLF